MTIDYDLATPTPRPISATIANFLRRSISLSDVLRHVLHKWFFVVIGLVLGFLYGVNDVWNTPINYTATMSLLPADSSGGGVSTSDTGSLGLLGALAGINSGSVPKFTRFVSAMPTQGVARELDRKYDMLCTVFKGQCDPKTHHWARANNWNAKINAALAHLAHQPDPNGPRTIQDLAGYVSGGVDAQPDPKKTGMLIVSYANQDPKFASEFLSLVVQTTNDYIKDQDRAVNQQYVEYLTRQLANTTSIAQHDAMSNLLLQQERNLMLTGVDVPYAASSMDKPTVSPSNPTNRILALDTVLGFFYGLAAAIILGLMPNKWRFWSRNWAQR